MSIRLHNEKGPTKLKKAFRELNYGIITAYLIISISYSVVDMSGYECIRAHSFCVRLLRSEHKKDKPELRESGKNCIYLFVHAKNSFMYSCCLSAARKKLNE